MFRVNDNAHDSNAVPDEPVPPSLQGDIERILFPRRRIAARIRALAGRIGGDFGDRPMMLAAIMTGSLIFVADLIRHLPLRMRIHLFGLSSYAGAATESDGARMLGQRGAEFAGKHVLIIDDILDSGRTLAATVEACRLAGAESIRTCVLLRKPPARRKPGGLDQVDYVGFDVPDVWVVGYGLDYGDYYRNLPDIAVLKKKC
jgi:hypoxanthine phosphoribosyltransferase